MEIRLNSLLGPSLPIIGQLSFVLRPISPQRFLLSLKTEFLNRGIRCFRRLERMLFRRIISFFEIFLKSFQTVFHFFNLLLGLHLLELLNLLIDTLKHLEVVASGFCGTLSLYKLSPLFEPKLGVLNILLLLQWQNQCIR